MYSLDSLDYTILDRLQLNPFNLARISRDIKIPYHIVRRRVNRLLREYRIVKLYAEPIYPKLGLSVVVFILNKQIETDIDVTIGYGKSKTVLLGGKTMLIHTIPKKFIRDLKKFIRILYGDDAIIFYKVYDGIVVGKKDFKLIDDEECFDRLYDDMPEMLTYEERLSPERFCETDLFIIKELQKDATISITDIARALGVSKQLIDYHLKRHVLARKLVEFNIIIFRDMRRYPMWLFLVDFNNTIESILFVNAISKVPLISSIVFSDSSIMFFCSHMSINLVLKLMQLLDSLLKRGIVISYKYYVQDPSFIPIRYTIPYALYQRGAWRRDSILSAVRKGRVELIQQLASTRDRIPR